MGTSLLGLTPANTYPALIKVGDNNGITSTLKTLSDGSGTNLPMQVSTTGVNFTGTVTGIPSVSGVAGAIQFSNGSAFASDAANLFWDDTNNRLGVGTNTPSKSLHIRTQHGVANGILLNSQNACGITITGDDYPNELVISKSNNQFEIATNGFFLIRSTVGLTINNPTIQGSGSTAATTALLVQNSSGTQLFKVSDDGASTMQSLNLTTGGGSLMINGANVLDRGDGNRYGYQSGSQVHRFFTNSGTERLTILNDGSVGIGTNAPTNTFEIASTSASPFKVATTASYFRATYQNASASGIFDFNSSSFQFPTNNVEFGTSSSLGARVGIKGSGSTSATSSLLVQNSAGTNMLKILDDGKIGIFTSRIYDGDNNDKSFYFSGNISVVSNFESVSLRVYDGTAYASGLEVVGANADSRVGIGTTSPNASAKLQLDSTTKGFLPPRMTTTQKNAIATPAAGLVVYDSTTNKLCCYNGSTWNDLF